MNVEQIPKEASNLHAPHVEMRAALPVKKDGFPRWIFVLVAIVVIGGVGELVHVKTTQKETAQAAASASAAADRVVPVIVATVETKDVPIVLEGLGSVLPLATVTVRTLIDGRLDQVNFKEGQTVKKGDLLAQVDPRPYAIQLRNAQAQAARDSANLENSKLNEQRYDSLVQQKLIATQQATDQRSQSAQLAAQVKQDEAAADVARLNLDYSRITSPIDGVTGVRLVDQGNIVHQADQGGIVVITQLDPIAVLFTLPEDVLPRIQRQLAKGKISVEAWSRDGLTKLGDGTLSVIDNQINATTATIRLKAVFPNPERVLWPNEFIKARMILATKIGAVTVPATVVQRGPQGIYAYVVGADKTVSMRPVEVEGTQGEVAIISKGLKPGEQVVADGQNQLRPGSKISSRPADKASPSPSAPASAGGSAAAPAPGGAKPAEGATP